MDRVLNRLKAANYKKIAQVSGLVILDTLVAGIIFYLLYYVFSIPLIWTVLVAVTSLVARSGLYDSIQNRD